MRVSRQRIARMQIERNIELLEFGPERPILRQVVIRNVSASPTCEKPLTSTPSKPRSRTQRSSSRIARSGSCIGNAASPWKRSGVLDFSAR